jgi:hypothetical protein
LQQDVFQFFDITAPEVSDEIDVSDGRCSTAIVVAGAGSIEGTFGSMPIRRGDTFALPAAWLSEYGEFEAGPCCRLPRAEGRLTCVSTPT